MRVHNILANVPEHLPQELCEQIATADSVKIERIVSRGHCSPDGFWYDQDRNEWVLLLSGRAGLLLAGDDNIVELQPGDYLNIPAHVKHRVEWTDPDQPTIWLAVHY